MAIKNIILNQGPDSRSAARLDVAVALAKANQARIVGVFVDVSPKDPEYWWQTAGREAMAEWQAKIETIGREREQAFEARLAAEGLQGEWRRIEGNPSDVMMVCARYGDLTIIGQTNPEEMAFAADLPDRLVLSTGSPVLVVPYAGDFKTVGRRVLVAWDGGREASRAVRDAMPILEAADRVKVHSLNPANANHLAGADICTHLARHGVRAEASHTVLGSESQAVSSVLETVGGFGFQQPGPWTQTRHPPLDAADVGNALLSAVTDFGVDLLVMGAYGHSRIRELVLGGATREILKTMTVPVLMSH